jgi:aspartyl/glutamyl-tRNA(Asn/Gln) amidotransferase C subunit
MDKKFTKEIVEDLADKLLIGLTDEENQMVLEEFEVIDETINIINEIDGIENVEPMTHTLDDFVYELREDVVEESCTIDEILSNCDVHNGREIEVPKVVGE